MFDKLEVSCDDILQRKPGCIWKPIVKLAGGLAMAGIGLTLVYDGWFDCGQWRMAGHIADGIKDNKCINFGDVKYEVTE